MELDEQLSRAELRVAAAAEPHKRRAVAAGTAVGAAVGEGGKAAAGDEGEGAWTTVLSRRARRLAKAARPGGTAGGAARTAAAARAAATWRTVVAILDHVGDGE